MKRIRTLLALLLVVTLGLAACTTTPAPTVALRDKLVVGMGADAVSLDPHRSNDQSSSRVRGQIYETLIAQDDSLNLIPGLAESWTQVDDLTFEFKLKQGVVFHDGSSFTAADVKFTFDRAVQSPDIGFIMNPIASTEVVDDFTVRLTTKFPFAPMLASLAHPAAAILSKAVVVDGYDFEMPIGTGPFKFVERVVGDSLTLARFDDYHGTKAVTPTVVFRVIPDNASRTIELETGGIDIAYDIAPGDVARVGSNPDLNLVRDPNLSMTYIGFNFQKAPFDNAKVRQAINLALDMDAIVEVVMRGVGAPAFGPIGPNVFGANTDLEPYPFDVEKAKALMVEAGFPDGFETTLWTNENQIRMDIAEIAQNQLAAIGIKVTVQVLEWGAYLAATAAGEHDMFILGWTTVTADADYGLFPLFHSSQFGGPGNRTYYSNPRVDELLELGRENVDPAVRLAAYREAQEIIRDDAPWIFVNTGENISGTSNKVTGFTQAPAGMHRLKNVGVTE
jgi:peptide/nickel transport system substrate-binding protein